MCGSCQKLVILWSHAKAFLPIERLSPPPVPLPLSDVCKALTHTLSLTLALTTPVTQHFAYAAEQQPVCLSIQTRLLQPAEPQSAAT